MAVAAWKDRYPRSNAGESLSFHLRNIIRSTSMSAPWTVTHSRELSILIATTLQGNLTCRYHQSANKTGVQWDGIDPSDVARAYELTGVHWDRRFIGHGNQKKGEKAQHAPPMPGYGHCGCDIDSILWDLIFFKEASITSTHPLVSGVSEGFGKQPLQPRIRALFIDLMQARTGLAIDDLFHFRWSQSRGKWQERRPSQLLDIQIAALQKRRDALWKKEVQMPDYVPPFHTTTTNGNIIPSSSSAGASSKSLNPKKSRPHSSTTPTPPSSSKSKSSVDKHDWDYLEHVEKQPKQGDSAIFDLPSVAEERPKVIKERKEERKEKKRKRDGESEEERRERKRAKKEKKIRKEKGLKAVDEGEDDAGEANKEKRKKERSSKKEARKE